jgi:hypothetical protein
MRQLCYLSVTYANLHYQTWYDTACNNKLPGKNGQSKKKIVNVTANLRLCIPLHFMVPLAASATRGASPQNHVYVRFIFVFVIIECLLYIDVWFVFKYCIVFCY